MSPYYISNPEFAAYRERAQRDREAAIARAGYLAIVAFARLQAGTARLILRRLERAIDSYRAWRDRRVALRELRLLDDRLLRDIGLTRADLDGVIDARGPQADRAESTPHSAVVVPLDAALIAYASGHCDEDWRQAA
jgi:uncharacterized protein YjiS (DUF1127 family)